MSRFMLAAVPVQGHVNPVLSLVRPLVDAGHDVRFVTGRHFEEKVTEAGARFFPIPEQHDFDWRDPDAKFPERAKLSRVRKLQFDMEKTLVAPAADQARNILGLLAEEPADALVADLGFVGANFVQALAPLPLALCGVTLLPYLSPQVPPPGLSLRLRTGWAGRLRNRLLNAVIRRAVFGGTTREYAAQRAKVGLPPVKGTIFDASVIRPELFLEFCAPGAEYPRTDLPPTVHFVGSMPLPSGDSWEPPAWWPELEAARRAGRPVVAVSQGTVENDPEMLLKPAIAGLAGEDVFVVAVMGGGDPAALGEVPANTRVARYLPYGRLLPLCSVFVTNGGFGSVQTSIAAGLPLVVAGKVDDKGDVAARVEYAGCGIDLRSDRPRAAAVRSAVLRVAGDPAYRARAEEIRAQAPPEEAPGRAVALLERLASTGAPVRNAAAAQRA
ncbi:glycosyltransferase [Streptomyces hoynatensis]|nr:nucleotide disphospho-sugar-binding domain-containing protein [Streptomyces hoynatensis]